MEEGRKDAKQGMEENAQSKPLENLCMATTEEEL